MSRKTLVMLGMVVGSTAGSYLPVLFGAGIFSLTSVIASAVGGILGIYIMYKVSS